MIIFVFHRKCNSKRFSPTRVWVNNDNFCGVELFLISVVIAVSHMILEEMCLLMIVQIKVGSFASTEVQ